MNHYHLLAVGAMAATSMLPVGAHAPVSNPCAYIQWNAIILNRYPSLTAACQTVEVQNGIKYAKFTARVVKIRHHQVVVSVFDVEGTPGGSIRWSTAPDDDLSINDKEIKVSNLNRGDTLTFWIQEGKFKIVAMPGGKGLAFANGRHTPAF